MTATITRFAPKVAPCGKEHDGELCVTEDDEQGLVTEDMTFSCGCRSTREEFHEGSCHRMTVDHHGKVLVDEELRGE